jgi:hypothetical protein
MNSDFEIDHKDRDLVIDLILQRTGVFLEIPGANIALRNWFAHGEREGLYEHLVRTNSLRYYISKTLAGLQEEAASISLTLPPKIGSLVSVGPGNGMIELILARSKRISELLLVDIERTSDHHHGYNQQGSGYADLCRTSASLMRYLGGNVNVITWNPLKHPPPVFKYDLLVSILSMGFHYPCDQYAEFIMENSKKGSILIIDKRKNVPDYGFGVISERCDIRVLSENAKSRRLQINIP